MLTQKRIITVEGELRIYGTLSAEEFSVILIFVPEDFSVIFTFIPLLIRYYPSFLWLHSRLVYFLFVWLKYVVCLHVEFLVFILLGIL
jgi:hypothetical protein